jgi:hypothetical protein
MRAVGLWQPGKPLDILTCAALALAAACSSPGPRVRTATPEGVSPAAARPTPTVQSSPYPYTTPLPPPTPTLLDGLYTKLDPKEGTPVPCRRCPDYAPEGGIWTLYLEKGLFRVFHTVTGWRSVGSFTVSGDRITLFNDPTCHQEVGLYAWTLEAGALTLKVIEDKCAIGLRAMNLTRQPWAACRPPSLEAAVSDHWQMPLGCDTSEGTLP